MNLTIIVLAAGAGTRMKSSLPKVLHPLAGRPMVAYVLDVARALEPVQLVVVTGHGDEQVRQALGPDLAYARQEQRLGTGHAVQQAAAAAARRAGTVLVVHGDTPLMRPETLRRMLEEHWAAGAAVTLLTFWPQSPAGYGRIIREAGTERVLAVVEDVAATAGERTIGEVNSGILCFRDAWLWPNLAALEPSPAGEFFLTGLVQMAIRQGETVVALPVADALEVMGVDHRAKLARAEAELRRRINEDWMLAGVTLIDPEATYIDAGVEIGPDTVVWPNTLLQGQTRIGAGCTIGPGAVIRSSRIGDGCRVELSVLEEAVMDDGSEIGPFGHMRKGGHLAQGAHMGNFGEIKNATLGPGAKMGHFSYLGDATVGAKANIGAGTITCNYDGTRKHRTEIGAGAFIGSDTMLVAPVTVGEGAKTGAGSVVTRDVPPGELVFGVPARSAARPPEEQAGESEVK